jgi:hypothetical protein
VVAAVAGFFLLGERDFFSFGQPSPVIKCDFHPASLAGSIEIKHNGHCNSSTKKKKKKKKMLINI